ncbi:PREDICTED: cap-specific mRNA (nucleoside-2'-O-)-methyltransferase 1 [Drosophila arizonae]|uniref:Cap-specific mRNA (nucleoside-2'-O-)-methyltransferase 1 n=1 Tax=Drosophila arizonae TaxID=7263 RepID=A0ABM1PSF0_DROAR|nr:PREDICTED: cap-specific mRNA (nucleoside-2'-O-)-methyltransferase 1 [Drosophila arizonae]
MEEQSDDENFEPKTKKIKRDWLNSYCYSNKAMGMMKKMGYEDDKGLGKSNQGRLEPVIAVQQDGRRGFGLKLNTDHWSAGKWDPSLEDLEIPESLIWLKQEGNNCGAYTLEQLMMQMVTGPRKLTIDDETQFCDPEILKHILSAKTVFDSLNDTEKRRARSRCNPFETIRCSIFLNRAAVKMANIDSLCQYMFTDPRDKNGQSLIGPNELLYFADMCAGPGGFSEYVLYRKSWEARGFGFTLRGSNDFKLEKFFAASPESFDTFYGVKDDGDIFNTSNQNSLNDYIRKHTPQGVHFAMADGGFSVEGQENIQEILSKQLYLCQFNTALKILRVGGSFVCKLFDLFTPFSVSLVYLMYKCFQQIAILKPNSSRPANSERYIICKYKLPDTEAIISYLDHVNEVLNVANGQKHQEDIVDVVELFNHNEMVQDVHFMEYIIDSNNVIGRKQIVGLRKIAAFAQNPELKEARQSEVRQECLKCWGLPDKLRQAPEVKPTERLLEELLCDWAFDRKWMNMPANELKSERQLHSEKLNVNDWHFMPIGRGENNINGCTLFLCKSRGNLWRYTDHRKWEQVESTFNIQPRTVFFGEIAFEYTGEARTSQSVSALHIMDAICLGGIDIRRRPFLERVSMCEKFARSLNKPYKQERTCGTIRCKPLFRLQDMDKFFGQMRPYTLKDNSQRLGFMFDDHKFFVPGGVLLFCELTVSYVTAYSRSHHQIYYFNTSTNESLFKDQINPSRLNEIFSSFRHSYMRRKLWKWTSTLQVDPCATEEHPNILYRSNFEQFIRKKLMPPHHNSNPNANANPNTNPNANENHSQLRS